MNPKSYTITDDDLHAYVDGVLAPDRRRIIEAYLAQHPAQQRRIAGWQAKSDELRSTLSCIIEEPLPPELTLTHLLATQRRRSFSGFGQQLRVAAGLLLALGIGATTGWFGRSGINSQTTSGNDTGIAALRLETNAAYKVFSNPLFSNMKQSRAAPETSDHTLLRALGAKFKVPDLTPAGFSVDRIAWVATTHGPAAVVMYGSSEGKRLLLLVRKMDVPASSDRMSEAHLNGHSQFTWISHGVGFSVASTGTPTTVHHIANQIRADERSL
jgi:anti-sigma factor RsiW